jgi:hypothetical protein
LKLAAKPKVLYWHEELPPLDGEVIPENMIEAVSVHVHGAIEPHGELWRRCYDTLMQHTEFRLEQEIARLGGHYAHAVPDRPAPRCSSSKWRPAVSSDSPERRASQKQNF